MKEYDDLESFLEHVALATSRPDWEDRKVNLMTTYASKGLSLTLYFYLVGYFKPDIKNQLRKGERTEEERRLAYGN